MLTCWCNSKNLQYFNEKYKVCEDCHTLVSQANDNQSNKLDLYNKAYWHEYQKNVLGFPDIVERSRLDLTERCLYWLKAILRHKLPAAKVLEIGSSHGGFLKLLKDCHYDVVGVEVDKEICDFSQQTFGVKTLTGPLANHNFDAKFFEIIMLFDVLEHLDDPLAMMSKCCDILNEQGILVIQTPKYDPDISYAALKERNDPFLSMLIPDEHLYLFSNQAIKILFDRIMPNNYHISYLDAFFPYDMFFIISLQPITTHDETVINEHLEKTSSSRIIRALLDVADERNKYLSLYLQADQDRAARLVNMQKLGKIINDLRS